MNLLDKTLKLMVIVPVLAGALLMSSMAVYISVSFFGMTMYELGITDCYSRSSCETLQVLKNLNP